MAQSILQGKPSACLLGTDIGTTATKFRLVAPDGRIPAETSRPAMLHSPQPNWVEEDSQDWWGTWHEP